MNRTEFIIATAIVLFVAFALGWFARWLAEFLLEPGADPWVSVRVKLNETGPVLAIAESAGHYYGVQTSVRVMVGGCG